ncbi:MAG TPA: MFS transporter [Ktedonobacteraceae bacterium]|jgi:predicted MFS family arabinose efflux permease|nr:MFS transporter [Ktedonobacteraceae bacterium]
MPATNEELIETEKAVPQGPKSLWLNLDYMLLWSGQMVSNVGTQVSTLAFPLLVLALTHSPAEAGLAGALRGLPYFIFTLPGGALIDRWDRKRVMILCDTGRALSLGSIPLAFALGHLTILQLYLVALIEGTLFVFFDLAETAALPQVVSKEQLPAATAQNQVAFGITSLLGPPLGGLLFSLQNILPFLADAVSYAVSVLSLLFIRVRFQQARVARRRRLVAEIAEGLQWLWRQPVLRTMAFLNSGLSAIGYGTPLIVIVLAQQQHASPALIGGIFAVGGISSISGAFLAPHIQRRFRFGQAIIGLWWLYAAMLLLHALASTPLILALVVGAFLLVDANYNIVQFSYRLALIPDELQGRVNSSFRLISYGLRPVGIALTGVLLQDIGAISTILVFGGCYSMLALWATLSPAIRKSGRLSEATER